MAPQSYIFSDSIQPKDLLIMVYTMLLIKERRFNQPLPEMRNILSKLFVQQRAKSFVHNKNEKNPMESISKQKPKDPDKPKNPNFLNFKNRVFPNSSWFKELDGLSIFKMARFLASKILFF